MVGSVAPATNGIGLGASGTQPPSSGATGLPPSHGRCELALRPAWANWMPGTAPHRVMISTMRARKA
jgi:hypothetical protein